VRAASALLTVVVGAATGVAAVAVHATVWGWPLAVAAMLVVAFALPPVWWGRPLFCGAWAVSVFVLSVPRPDGDYLVSGDLAGYGLLLVAVLAVLVGLVALVRGRARADAGARPTPP
jgi:hypothetical protein